MSPRASRQRVIVVGAGPVGLGVAALLKTGRVADRLELVVLDEQPEPSWDGRDYGLRVYALSRASQRMFERLGLWSRLVAGRVSPYRRMRVWEGEDADGPTALDFDAADLGEPDLGHIVEDSLLRDALLSTVRDRPGVSLGFGIDLEHIERRGREGVHVELRNGERLSAGLLVAADGGSSRVRTLLGMPIATHDYAQTALVAHVGSEYAHRETALQRFLPTGPLAFLPLKGGMSSIVWSLPNAQAAALMSLAEPPFVARLEAASGGVLGRLTLASERRGFPLRLLHALRYTEPGVALAGDAAHCVHPLAGQGMNLGLLDAVSLAGEVERACARGDGVGDAVVLRRYERERKGHNVLMMTAFDVLERSFRRPGACAALRHMGVAALQRLPFAKRLLMAEALGLKRGLAGRAA